MHRILKGLLVLVVALNGMACACAPPVGDDAAGQHAEHHMPPDNPGDCHGTTCDHACDGVTASRAEAPAFAAPGRFQFPDSGAAAPAPHALAPDERWRRAIRTAPAPPPRNPHPATTPVALGDRMLD